MVMFSESSAIKTYLFTWLTVYVGFLKAWEEGIILALPAPLHAYVSLKGILGKYLFIPLSLTLECWRVK